MPREPHDLTRPAMTEITRHVLRDYFHDALPDAATARVEAALRERPEVRALFEAVRQDEDRGDHSVGAVWRRERVSCPTRDQLGAHLLGAADPDLSDYVDFHLDTVGCPVCRANRDDLERVGAEAPVVARDRHARILDSTAGVLRAAERS